MKYKCDINRLIIVLGDQLDYQRFLPDDYDQSNDIIWMAEAEEESTNVFSNKHRIVYFLSSMRHFRNHLSERKLPFIYHELEYNESGQSLGGLLARDLDKYRPSEIRLVKPGDHRVEKALKEVVYKKGLKLDLVDDPHFICSEKEFQKYAEGRKSLRLEFFYRELRRKHGFLMDGKNPVGGEWNFDKENRQSFGKSGPSSPPTGRGVTPDKITREVIKVVNRLFPDHPGNLDLFCWPVTPLDAEKELDRFILDALPLYGRFQDAMWMGEPTLYHSLTAAPLNLRLLDPRLALKKAEEAFKANHAPIAAVEGFIRQILGWREYVRGIYNLHMPKYRSLNSLGAEQSLPKFFWSGKTDMACMQSCLTQVLETGYGHHIQRLMVIGLYAQTSGIRPDEINDWFLASYVDAVDWVTTPNVIGMSQFADGGLMASKPYCATGAYINRMSNYCKGCRYDPKQSSGEHACPFTSLYWSFLDKHRESLGSNPRMTMQMRNLQRMDNEKLKEIIKAKDSHLARTES